MRAFLKNLPSNKKLQMLFGGSAQKLRKKENRNETNNGNFNNFSFGLGIRRN
jgi:hypothetical protein